MVSRSPGGRRLFRILNPRNTDMTMEYGHVPVENRDYRYNDKVSIGTSAKKVALFKINDLSDINITSRVVG